MLVMKRGSKMRVDDVAGNICEVLLSGFVRRRHRAGRGLHSFPVSLNFSLLCPFPFNLSLLCAPYTPHLPVDVSRRCSS